MSNRKLQSCIFCNGDTFSEVFHYDAPPKGEIQFKFSKESVYSRDILQCKGCSHYYSLHSMDMSGLYNNDYVTSTYGDGGIKGAYEKIINLDPTKSDNVGRVKRINLFASSWFESYHDKTVLDVGSGLAVFPYRMKQSGWDVTALDPDPRAAKHAKDIVGVKSICGDFLEVKEIGHFHMISFNKVLEHLLDPIEMLKKSREHLVPGGFVYIELPDGVAASHEGKGREEFFIDHHHIFSTHSTELLARLSGYKVHSIESLKEPSTKYTIRAFLI